MGAGLRWCPKLLWPSPQPEPPFPQGCHLPQHPGGERAKEGHLPAQGTDPECKSCLCGFWVWSPVHLASGVPLGTLVLVLLLLEIGFPSLAQVVLYTEDDVGFMVSLVYVVPGIAPRTLCVLGKHSTSRATFPILSFF